jgi:hypothetical protein
MEMEDDLVLHREGLLSEMKAALEDAAPDPDGFDWPAPAEGEEDDAALYASTRSYIEQVDLFRRHRGDDEDVRIAADRLLPKICKGCDRSFMASGVGGRLFCTDSCRDKSTARDRRARANGGEA